jgi:hypothetical protein
MGNAKERIRTKSIDLYVLCTLRQRSAGRYIVAIDIRRYSTLIFAALIQLQAFAKLSSLAPFS